MTIIADHRCPYCDEPELWEAYVDEQGTTYDCRCYTCDYRWDWQVDQPWPQPERFSLTAHYPTLNKVLLAHLSPLKVESDYNLINAIKAFMPPTSPTLPTYDQLLQWSGGQFRERDLGFGDKVVHFAKYNAGYINCVLSAILFEGQLAEVKMVCDERRGMHTGYGILYAMWGEGIRRATYGYTYRLTSDDIMAQRQAVYARELGEMPDVPKYGRGISDYCEMLTEPHHSYSLGSACGYAGERPEGHIAIKHLFAEFRFDLIRSVLRGANPEGRVYAALILFQAEQIGIPLLDEDRAAIDRIKQLPILVHTCGGCTSFEDVTAEHAFMMRKWILI